MSSKLNININDFNTKAIEKWLLTNELISNLNLRFEELTLLEYINILNNKSYITLTNADDVLYELFLWKYPIFQKYNAPNMKEWGNYYKLNKPWEVEEIYNINIKSKNEVVEIYNEAVELFWFDNPNSRIVIYDINYEKETLIFFIPLIDNNIIDKLKKFKKEAKSIIEDNKHIVKNPITGEIEDKVMNLKNFKIEFYIAPNTLINQIIERNRKTERKLQEQSAILEEKKKNSWFFSLENLEVKTLEEGNTNIEDLLKIIFEAQSSSNASDIHIEPILGAAASDNWYVRVRVDGELKEPMPISLISSVIRDIKSLSKLNVNQKDLPQDWKLVLKMKMSSTWLMEELHYRVSTIPIWESWQEKVVLRRLSSDASSLDLEKMWMDKEYKDMIDNMIWNPKKDIRGKFRDWMILMTWPTGSWKTTTLFSILNQLNTHKVNIQTLEDPIEYVIPNINQSQISDVSLHIKWKEPYTYERGLRAILRQDPDIILVWEIRDEVTMEVAKDAAATWHLLLSSLHTNNTWETLDRMVWLNFDLSMVWNVVRLIMAQRLWRKICPYCRLEYNDPALSKTAEEKRERDKRYLQMKMDIYKALLDSPYILELPEHVSEIKVYQWKWCLQCARNWERWRMWIYEFLPITLNVQNFIAENGIKAPKEKVRELFIKEHIATLYQNAMYKVFKGKKDINGKIEYMSYWSAISSAGSDLYDFASKYKNLSITELETLCKIKKNERKRKDLEEKFQELDYQIQSKTRDLSILETKEEKEKLLEEINLLKEQKNKIYYILFPEKKDN